MTEIRSKSVTASAHLDNAYGSAMDALSLADDEMNADAYIKLNEITELICSAMALLEMFLDEFDG